MRKTHGARAFAHREKQLTAIALCKNWLQAIPSATANIDIESVVPERVVCVLSTAAPVATEGRLKSQVVR